MDDLTRRFVAGDEAAFEALFKAHQHEVYRWIIRLEREPGAAEDLTIEAFWRIYRGRALGLLLARTFNIDFITPAFLATLAPVAMALYYLAWKYLVGYCNAVLGVG